MATVAGHQGQSVSWHTACRAEAVASGASSTSCQDRLEKVGVLPIVMTELKLSQVDWKIFADVLIRAHDGALQERPERFDVLSVNLAAHVFALTVAHDFMLRNEAIPRVFVGCDKAYIICHYFSHEATKRRSISILDDLASYVAFAADRTNDRSLAGRTACHRNLLVPMAVVVLATNVGFVYLDRAHKFREVFILHCGTDALKYVPSRLIRARTDHSMNLKGRDALFALAHQIDNFKPRPQWIVGVLENRLDNNGESIAVLLAITALPVESLFERVDLIVATSRAFNHAIRPPHVAKQSRARIIICVIALDVRESQIRLSGQWLIRLHAMESVSDDGLCQVRYNLR